MRKLKPSCILLLASRSPRRRQLLRSLQIPFRVVKSNYKERLIPSLSQTPVRLVTAHASGKAREAILPNSQRFNLVLSADTIVVCHGLVFGKPKNHRQAQHMLQMLSGKTHHVVTGIALRQPPTGREITATARTKVIFKKLDKTAILRYLEAVNPLDKAGGYAIQEGPKIVRRIHGSRSNVIGLPLELLKKKLKEVLQWYE